MKKFIQSPKTHNIILARVVGTFGTTFTLFENFLNLGIDIYGNIRIMELTDTDYSVYHKEETKYEKQLQNARRSEDLSRI